MSHFPVNRLLRWCFAALIQAACLLPWAARAQPVTCPVAANTSWTGTESWVWKQICTGGIADLTIKDPAQLSMTSASPWPAERTISAAFLEAILTEPRYKLTASVSPIHIIGARIEDPVAIANATLQNRLVLEDSRFDAGFKMYDSTSTQGLVLLGDRLGGPFVIAGSNLEYLEILGTAGRDLNIANAVFAGDVQFDSVRFAGPFEIGGSKIQGSLGFFPVARGAFSDFADFTILDTRIDGETSISTAVFNGVLDGGLTDFGGGLSITDARFADTAFFYDTDFAKTVDVQDSAFDRDLRFDTSKFESALALSDVDLCVLAKPCELFFKDANFGGEVTIENNRINGDINANGATASASVTLVNDSDPRHPLAVKMMDAAFARDLTIDSTKLSYLELTNASVTGTLQFLSGPGGLWTKNALLGLSGATIGVLSNAAWDWPARMDLEGMRFGLIGLKRPDLDHGCINGNWSAWLRATQYSPEPYQQLAKYLSDSGHPHAAACVLETSQTIALGKMRPLQRIVYWAYGQVAGFGYAPERAFWFAAGFVLIGMVVLRVTGQGRKNNMPIGLFYSFSEFIPLVSLDKKFDDVALEGLARWYFYLHKIVGYIIALFIAAALSGLSNKG